MTNSEKYVQYKKNMKNICLMLSVRNHYGQQNRIWESKLNLFDCACEDMRMVFLVRVSAMMLLNSIFEYTITRVFYLLYEYRKHLYLKPCVPNKSACKVTSRFEFVKRVWNRACESVFVICSDLLSSVFNNSNSSNSNVF